MCVNLIDKPLSQGFEFTSRELREKSATILVGLLEELRSIQVAQ
jgi:hypothetical protein